jgi:GNAT superfamily N-acetyltransferase
MIVKELFLKYSWEEIKHLLGEFYPCQHDYYRRDPETAFSNILKTEPLFSDKIVEINADSWEFWDGVHLEYEVDLTGYGGEPMIDPACAPWGEWLGAKIDNETLKKMPHRNILLHIVYVMCQEGTEEADITLAREKVIASNDEWDRAFYNGEDNQLYRNTLFGIKGHAYRIRDAEKADASVLTDISFAAKKHWNYPKEFLERWKDELTITESYIENNLVFACEYIGTNDTQDIERHIIAYFSLFELEKDVTVNISDQAVCFKKGWWLEHMFIAPLWIGRGIGREMFQFVKYLMHGNNLTKHPHIQFKKLNILVDPNAAGFYEKMGCEYIKEIPSSIPGRTTPLYQYIRQKLPQSECLGLEQC